MIKGDYQPLCIHYARFLNTTTGKLEMICDLDNRRCARWKDCELFESVFDKIAEGSE